MKVSDAVVVDPADDQIAATHASIVGQTETEPTPGLNYHFECDLLFDVVGEPSEMVFVKRIQSDCVRPLAPTQSDSINENNNFEDEDDHD